jgi:hypothetical protein
VTRTRWTGLAGLLFGLVFFAINVFGPSTPDAQGANAATKFADYWNNDGHQTKAIVGILLVSYAVLLLVAFSAGLRDRLRSLDAGPLPSYVLAAGTAAAALMAAGAAASFSVGFAASDASALKVDGGLALTLDDAGYVMLTAGLMLAGSMAVAVGIVTLRTKAFPVWTAWLGFLLGLAVAGSLFTAWIAFLGLPIWSVAMGIVLLLRNDAAEPAAAA